MACFGAGGMNHGGKSGCNDAYDLTINGDMLDVAVQRPREMSEALTPHRPKPKQL